MKKMLIFGVFDYFHLGHLRLFKQCKEQADYLIVAVQEGSFIKQFKPEANVLYSTEERTEIINSIKIVDEVIVYDSVNIELLKKVEFDILGLGEDQVQERFMIAEDWCKLHDKSVVRLKRTKGISSSSIKDQLK